MQTGGMKGRILYRAAHFKCELPSKIRGQDTSMNGPSVECTIKSTSFMWNKCYVKEVPEIILIHG